MRQRPQMRRAFLVLVAIAATTLPAEAHVGQHSVTVRNNVFEPQRLEVDPGETVTWFAQDGGHTVTSDDGVFDFPSSGTLSQGDTAQWTPLERGVRTYHCKVHAGMRATLVVGPALRIEDVTLTEGDAMHEVSIPVALSRAVDHEVAVEYATSDGTAHAGDDYDAASGTLRFPAGTVTRTIRLVVHGDTERHPTRALSLALSNVVGAALERATATIRIANDDDAERLTPSAAYPTLSSALEGIKPDTVVRVGPDLPPLTAPVTVATDRIAILGEGPASVLEPAGDVSDGIRVRALGIVIADLTVRRFRISGIDVRDASDYEIRNVVLTATNWSYGVRAVGARWGRITDVTVSNASRAGISIEGCEPCDTVVSRLDASLSYAGFEAVRASSVVLLRSRLHANWNGAILRSRPAETAFQYGAHLYGNVIESSGDPRAKRTASSQTRAERGDLVAGAGIWIGGGWLNTVESNQISGGRYGVIAAGFGAPSNGNTILRNTLTGMPIGLGWDGVGIDTCFSANTGDGAARTSPPATDVVYDCALPATVGIPNPALTADLLVTGAG